MRGSDVKNRVVSSLANVEVDSFITKLKHLWQSGYKASLNIEVCEGKATVTLTADVGYALPPSSPVKARGPSYQRRQERRRNAFRNNEVKPEIINDKVAEQAVVESIDDTMNEVTEQEAVVSTNYIVEVPTEVVTGQRENIESNSATEEVLDEDELARDKLVDEVIVYAVPPSDIRQPVPTAHEVEEEIRDRFFSMGVDVVNIKHRTMLGKYESSLVKLTPVNLRRIWGRRLGLSNCAVVEFKPSDVR